MLYRRATDMDTLQLMKSRHAVRQYTDKKIEGETLEELKKVISSAKEKSGLKFQLLLNEPNAFDCRMSRKLGFKNANNYIAIIGKKTFENEMNAGYFGTEIVLKAQELGLNTCFVAATFSKRKAKYTLNAGEKLICIITVGYGETQGTAHINCSIDKLCDFRGDMPPWFMKGMEYAMLAPTALNKQKFCLILRNGNEVKLTDRGGACKGVTLGIVKYHFEKGAGKENFKFV